MDAPDFTPPPTVIKPPRRGNAPGKGSLVTEEKWERILEGFRKFPGMIQNAAKFANVKWETAQRAWEHGWPKRPYGRVPIKVILKQEADAKREDAENRERLLAAKEDEERYARRQATLDAQKDEAGLSKAARKNALNLAVVANKLLVVVDKLVNEFNRRTSTEKLLEEITPGEIRRWVGTTGALVDRAERVMRIALEIERIHTGQPIAVVGMLVEHLSTADIVKEFEVIERNLQRARAIDGEDLLNPALAVVTHGTVE